MTVGFFVGCWLSDFMVKPTIKFTLSNVARLETSPTQYRSGESARLKTSPMSIGAVGKPF